MNKTFVSKPVSDLSAPNWDGIGTFPANGGEVVKASAGHYPQPFLISTSANGGLKRTGAKIIRGDPDGKILKENFYRLLKNKGGCINSLPVNQRY
jgi:hypothetical protein